MKMQIILILVSLAFTAGAQESFDVQIRTKLDSLHVTTPTAADPLSLNAVTVIAGDSIAVILKARMAEGWHIYHLVPPNQPYVKTEYVLDLPENILKDGKWSVSDPRPSPTDHGVLIHEEEAWFIYKTAKTGVVAGPIRAGLYYQICDIRQCLPPVEKTIELNVENKS